MVTTGSLGSLARQVAKGADNGGDDGIATPEIVHESTLEPVQRSLAVQLYLDCLARLMQIDVADGPDLSAEEQRRLRTRAAVGTIETLTTLRRRTLRQRPPPGGTASWRPPCALPTAHGSIVGYGCGLR